MSRPILLARILLIGGLLALAACGGPRGDWRAQVGRPTGNLALVEPRPALAIPPDLALPPPLAP